MNYTLDSLLIKMGAPEVQTQKRVHWYYFERGNSDLAGFAEIRLEDGGKRLVAELKHSRSNHTGDDGNIHPLFEETFYLCAELTRGGKYKVKNISLDKETYLDPQKSIVELALSIFHARALDISILMVEHLFNQQDIMDRVDHFLDVAEAANGTFTTQAPLERQSASIIQFPVVKRERVGT